MTIQTLGSRHGACSTNVRPLYAVVSLCEDRLGARCGGAPGVPSGEAVSRNGSGMSTPASSTVLKAFHVLDLFRSQSALGAAECARLLGMPRASAYRILISLVEAGALETTPSGQYRLTLKMFELGLRVPRQRWLVDAAYIPMEVLVTRTALAAHLAVRDGLELVYVVKLRHAPDRTRAQAGDRNCLHATALGKVLLAHAPYETAEQLLERGLWRFTPHTLTTRQQLMEQLEQIREEGCAYDREERTIGLVSTAVPIWDPLGRVVASLSVLGPVERYRARLEQLARELDETRDQIERNLRSSRHGVAATTDM